MKDAMTNIIMDAGPAPGRVARKRAEVRRKLLLAGFDLVGRQGLDAFAVADLTEAADCSKGAFYSHFANRDEFVAELVSQAIEVVGTALDRYSANLPGDEALATGLRYSLTLARLHPAWGHFVSAVASTPRYAFAGLGKRLASDIARARAEGRIAFRDPQAALLLASGTFLAGAIGSGLGIMGADTPGEATRHLLLGLGVSPERASALTKDPLPALNFESAVVKAIAPASPAQRP